MAKRKKKAPAKFVDERVTLVNVKGYQSERDWLAELSRKTGVPLSTIVRRGIACWTKQNTKEKPPAEWTTD